MALFKPFDMAQMRKEKPRYIRELIIDLSSSLSNQVYTISGDFLHVLECTGNAKIRLNEETAPEIDCRKVKRIKTPFYRFYVTSTAQTQAKLKLIIGAEAGLDFQERRTSYETILHLDDQTLTNAAGSTSHTLNLSGYKEVRIYFDCNKNATVIIFEYPLDANIIADYVYSEQIGLASNRKFTRIIDSGAGAVQIAIYNNDSTDDMTYDLIVQGVK